MSSQEASQYQTSLQGKDKVERRQPPKGPTASPMYLRYQCSSNELHLRAHLDFDSKLDGAPPPSPTPFLAPHRPDQKWILSHNDESIETHRLPASSEPQEVPLESSLDNLIEGKSSSIHPSRPMKLLEEEKAIFSDLKEFMNSSVNPFQDIGLNAEEVELRVAGGWVRDRLIHRPTKDIDIAISGLSGVDFARRFVEWMHNNGRQAGRLAVIQANPDQSKHLETATVNLHSLPVDFVNLRSERYTNSRIPEVRVGTPDEDSFRRDFCCNSLFYNILTERIEDRTGFGIHDLERGLLRTPLLPEGTFLDDPLRVLRCIRFATRYRYGIMDEVLQGMSLASVRDALKMKVSRERIGIEIGSTFADGCHVSAMQLLRNLELCEIVFGLPESGMPIAVAMQQLLQMVLGTSPGFLTSFIQALPPYQTRKRDSNGDYLNSASGSLDALTPNAASFPWLLEYMDIDSKEFFKIIALTGIVFDSVLERLPDRNAVTKLVTSVVVDQLRWPKRIIPRVVNLAIGALNVDAYLNQVQREENATTNEDDLHQNTRELVVPSVQPLHLSLLSDSGENLVGLSSHVPEIDALQLKNVPQTIIRGTGSLWPVALMIGCVLRRLREASNQVIMAVELGEWAKTDKPEMMNETDVGCDPVWHFHPVSPLPGPISIGDVRLFLRPIITSKHTPFPELSPAPLLDGDALLEVAPGAKNHPIMRTLSELGLQWGQVYGNGHDAKEAFRVFVQEHVLPNQDVNVGSAAKQKKRKS